MQIVDALHALTVFCQCDLAIDHQRASSRGRLLSQKEGAVGGTCRRRTSSSGCVATSGASRRISQTLATRVPTYKNNFNQAQSGVEGVLMGAMLGPLLGKLAANAHEFNQPENMSYAQVTQ